ncbi:MAG TPA: hypothetical protein PK957_00400 [Candidatus Dojkabacteria bacterium]|nr:hypothetical protein [Candidatus Dojkabacteria bacterium]HQF36073.1 hypothetical protein [Candidatus Dojkabacteria bacterium]
MANDDLVKNLKKMEESGYFKEDMKIDPGSFSLDGLIDDDEESKKKGKPNKNCNK